MSRQDMTNLRVNSPDVGKDPGTPRLWAFRFREMGKVFVATEDACFIARMGFFCLGFKSEKQLRSWAMTVEAVGPLHPHPTTRQHGFPLPKPIPPDWGERGLKLPFLYELMQNFDLT